MSVVLDKSVGRAKNAVLDFLQHRLYVPKIYVNASWNDTFVDVLAIDRDGSGDVHAALVFAESYTDDGRTNRTAKMETEYALLNRFQQVSAQYKWVCRIRTNAQTETGTWRWPNEFLDATFNPDGLGRVGFVLVDLSGDEEARVSVELKPERFRAFVGDLASSYVAEHKADWEIREEVWAS